MHARCAGSLERFEIGDGIDGFLGRGLRQELAQIEVRPNVFEGRSGIGIDANQAGDARDDEGGSAQNRRAGDFADFGLPCPGGVSDFIAELAANGTELNQDDFSLQVILGEDSI